MMDLIHNIDKPSTAVLSAYFAAHLPMGGEQRQ